MINDLPTFDQWYTSSIDSHLIEAAIKRFGLVNIALAADAGDLLGEGSGQEDAKLAALLERIDAIGCGGLFVHESMRLENIIRVGGKFDESIFDSLRGVAKAGGNMLRRAIDRLLAPVARFLATAFNKLIGAWHKIKPLMGQISQSLTNAQKKKLAGITAAVKTGPALIEAASRFPKFVVSEEDVATGAADHARTPPAFDASSPQVLAVTLSVEGAETAPAPQQTPKNTELNQLAGQLASDKAIMAIVGVAGVLFGAAFGGLAVGAVALLGLIVGSWVILQWLKRYAAESKNEQLKQAVNSVDSNAVKTAAEEAAATVAAEVKPEEKEKESPPERHFLTRSDGAPIFAAEATDNITLIASDADFELHTKDGAFPVNAKLAETMRARDGKDSGSQVKISFHIKDVSGKVVVNDRFTENMNAALKKIVGDAPPSKPLPEGSVRKMVRQAIAALTARDFNGFRVQVWKLHETGMAIAKAKSLPNDWNGYIDGLRQLANALAEKPTITLAELPEEGKKATTEPGISDLTAAMAAAEGLEPNNFNLHLLLKETEAELIAALRVIFPGPSEKTS